jgi:hypothetical protein
MLIVLSFVRNFGNFIYYSFTFLILEQQYKCRFGPADAFEVCSKEDTICPALEAGTPGLEYQIDTSYVNYLWNWYAEMDLLC